MSEETMKLIPFDVNRAKRITAGIEPGSVVTRGMSKVRITCFDMRSSRPIVALVTTDDVEEVFTYHPSGRIFLEDDEDDLMLHVPSCYREYDVLSEGCRIYVFKQYESPNGLFSYHFCLDERGVLRRDGMSLCYPLLHYATMQERIDMCVRLSHQDDATVREIYNYISAPVLRFRARLLLAE